MGHLREECQDSPCIRCKEIDHVLADCPQPDIRQCGNCGQRGHFKKECPNPKVKKLRWSLPSKKFVAVVPPAKSTVEDVDANDEQAVYDVPQDFQANDAEAAGIDASQLAKENAGEEEIASDPTAKDIPGQADDKPDFAPGQVEGQNEHKAQNKEDDNGDSKQDGKKDGKQDGKQDGKLEEAEGKQ